MWFFTTPVFLALVPYFIYSVFHVITYFSEYVLPAITSRPARPQEDRLAQIARKYQDAGSQSVAKVEVYGILLRLLVGVLLYFPHICSCVNGSFSKLAFIQLPVFAVFLRYKYFNTAYTRTSLRELSANIDRLVNPLPPVARDIWVKIRDSISYYGTRPLVAGEGVPSANTTGPQGGSATGTQRSTSGATQRGI
jgi:transmembrane protein 33